MIQFIQENAMPDVETIQGTETDDAQASTQEIPKLRINGILCPKASAN
jgi:hypothetical protein